MPVPVQVVSRGQFTPAADGAAKARIPQVRAPPPRTRSSSPRGSSLCERAEWIESRGFLNHKRAFQEGSRGEDQLRHQLPLLPALASAPPQLPLQFAHPHPQLRPERRGVTVVVKRCGGVPQGATDVELQRELAAWETVPVLSVRHVRNAFCRFEDADVNAAFERLVGEVMRPIPWCSECHPEGCAHYVADGTLKSGVIKPTRGEHEMFCKEFPVPQAVCA
jgi:hypothetical protein